MTRIALHRGGGHGDILCLTSVIPGLLEKYPDAEIDFYTKVGCEDLVLHDPRITHVQGISTIAELPAEEYDMVIAPDHGPEWDAPIPVVQCRMAGLPFNPPRYYPTDEEFDSADVFDIAACVRSSTPTRDSLFLDEAVEILEKRYSLVQVDNGDDVASIHPDLSIREAAALIAKSRMAITVDTSFMHVAIALGVPTLVVFGLLTGPHNQYVGNAEYLIRPDTREIVGKVDEMLS